MLRLLTVVGARPQFIKASVVSRALQQEAGSASEVIVHTGQHYDEMLSDVFFRELGIPAPKYTLECGGGSHGLQTSRMLAGLERTMMEEHPDLVLVYGDTNSTLAGALAAAKLDIPIAHVEAGLRSFNRKMPEEINRVLTDHISSALFAPSDAARENLENEGIVRGVHVVGDVMLDAARFTLENPLSEPSPAPSERRLDQFGVLTLHRASITEDADKLIALLQRATRTGTRLVFPVHPRVRSLVEERGITLPEGIDYVAPVGHHAMLDLVNRAQFVLTDSGGLQKEAYFLKTPCVTLRSETEWKETIQTGWNVLCDPLTGNLDRAIEVALAAKPENWIPLYGDGRAAQNIVRAILATAS